jgi:hypothetical protein
LKSIPSGWWRVFFFLNVGFTKEIQDLIPHVRCIICYCALQILYIKINVCLFVCLFVCMYVCMELIQIHISEPIWAKLCTRFSLGLKETIGYVWTRNSWLLRHFESFFFGGHCRIMGTRWLSARPFTAITLYPWFQLVLAWRHRHYVVAEGGVIRGSLISVILAEVRLTSRKLRRSRRQSHPPQRRIPYSGGCSSHVTDITFNQATGPSTTALYPSFQLLFLWPTRNHALADDSCAFLLQVSVTRNVMSVMHTIHWDVNGIHAPTIRNLIRREGSDKGIAIIQITSNLSNLCPSMWFQISAFPISHPE